MEDNCTTTVDGATAFEARRAPTATEWAAKFAGASDRHAALLAARPTQGGACPECADGSLYVTGTDNGFVCYSCTHCAFTS